MNEIRQLCADAERHWNDRSDPLNFDKAVALYARAYRLGDTAMAPYRLAGAHYRGIGAPKDLEKAFEYASLPSLDGIRSALHLRGCILKNPKFSRRDDRQALAVLRQAARLGVEAASAELAELENRYRCPLCATVRGLESAAGETCTGCGALSHHRAFAAAYRDSIRFHYPLEMPAGRMDLLADSIILPDAGAKPSAAPSREFLFAERHRRTLDARGVLFLWRDGSHLLAAPELTRLFQVQVFSGRDPHTQDAFAILACTKRENAANDRATAAAHVARSLAEARQSERAAAGGICESRATPGGHLPDAAYARQMASIVVPSIRKGGAHTTLGRNISERSRRQGQDTFEYYRDVLGVCPSSRVLEFGCGSLRVGRGFIAFLDAGHYFAMDVVPDYFEIGAQIVGADLIVGKAVQFALIDRNGVTRGIDFGADQVFCSAVMFHVHPEDIESTARNLTSLASRPGAKLIFDAKISGSAPVRFLQSEGTPGWAWPLSFYQALLWPLELVGVHRRARYDKAPGLEIAHLEFRNPYPAGDGAEVFRT